MARYSPTGYQAAVPGQTAPVEEPPAPDEGYQRGGAVRGQVQSRKKNRKLGKPLARTGPRRTKLRKWIDAPVTGYMKRGVPAAAYAYGGPVYGEGGSSSASTSDSGTTAAGPLAMSAALDSRRHNPQHAVEDAEALSTRPAGAPQVPEEFAYCKGGAVRRTGYQRGGEVEDNDEGLISQQEVDYDTAYPVEQGESRFLPPTHEVEPEQPPPPPPPSQQQEKEEPPPQQEEEEVPTPRPRPVEADEEDIETAPPYQVAGQPQPPPQRTGYNAEPTDQTDREAEAIRAQAEVAKTPTGYTPTQADPLARIVQDPGGALRDVLDWTRRALKLPGYTAPTATVERPETPVTEIAPPRIEGDTSKLPTVPTRRAAAEPAAEQYSPEQLDAERKQQAALARAGVPVAPTEPATRLTLPESIQSGGSFERGVAERHQQLFAGPAQRYVQRLTQDGTPAVAPTAAAPTDQQALHDYLKGDRSFTPQQMTDILNRTSAADPTLDQNGAIRKAFHDLVANGDMDGASRFVQSLRPSYDNVRAAMIAAASQGDYGAALQLAGRLNNLIPNGRSVDFVQTEDGRITAIVRPDNGGPATTFSLTPQQFSQYAMGPSSVFDIAAQEGIEKKFAQLTGSQGAPGEVTTAAPAAATTGAGGERTTPGGIPITTPPPATSRTAYPYGTTDQRAQIAGSQAQFGNIPGRGTGFGNTPDNSSIYYDPYRGLTTRQGAPTTGAPTTSAPTTQQGQPTTQQGQPTQQNQPTSNAPLDPYSREAAQRRAEEANNMFPWASQTRQRANYERQLMQRDITAAKEFRNIQERNVTKQTPEQKMDIERMKEDGRNLRNANTVDQRRDAMNVRKMMSDNNIMQRGYDALLRARQGAAAQLMTNFRTRQRNDPTATPNDEELGAIKFANDLLQSTMPTAPATAAPATPQTTTPATPQPPATTGTTAAPAQPPTVDPNYRGKVPPFKNPDPNKFQWGTMPNGEWQLRPK